MKIMKKILLLFLFICIHLSISIGRSEIICNSNEWKDCYIVFMYSKIKGNEFQLVNSMGEAKILSMELNKKNEHIVFESKSNSIVKNFKEFLQIRGFEHVNSKYFEDYQSLQFEIFEEVKNNINGLIIIHDDFGYDALSVTPYALLKKYFVLFYNENVKSKIIKTLNENYELNVIFYGEFLDRPWKKIKNNFTIIDEKSFIKNNLAIIDLYMNISKEKIYFFVSSGDYFEPGFLSAGMPITFIEIPPSELIEILKKYNISIIEIIGPENTIYGQQIRDLSNRTIGVVVRVGRTFTGSEELRGKQVPLRILSLPKPFLSLKIEDVYLVNNDTLLIQILNDGNIDTYFFISGVGLLKGDKEIFPQFNYSIQIIPKSKSFALPIKLENLSIESFDGVEILGLTDYEIPLKNYIHEKYNLSLITIDDDSIISIDSVSYFVESEILVIKVKNEGNSTVFVYGSIYDMDIFGLNRSLYFDLKEIKPKQIGELKYKIHLDEDDLERNKEVKINLFYGKNKDFLIKSISEKKELKVVKGIIITSLITAEGIIYILTVILLIVVAILFFVFKKRKNINIHNT